MSRPMNFSLRPLSRLYHDSRVQVKVVAQNIATSILRRDFTPEQAIIIAGSGRSGTSWILNTLGDRLGYQTLFEPLSPNFVPRAKSLLGVDLLEDPVIYSPYLRSTSLHSDWQSYLTKALTGRIRNYWTDKKRVNLLPSGYIIKFIRANLMLSYINKNFGSKTIFVMRHPCAVIFSRLQLNWKASKQNLLSQEELVEDYLRPFLVDIEQEKDPVGEHAIWWAVEQYVALDNLKKQDHYFAHYEDIYLNPEQQYQKIISWLEILSSNAIVIDQDRNRLAEDEGHFRLRKWVSGLSQEEKDKILWWKDRFGIDHYNDDIYPVQGKRN